MELVIRSKIGPYEVAAHLDSGGMADVYLAHGNDPSDLVVVKVMRDHLKGVAEISRMFAEESRIMRRLSHRNVVAVRDSGSDEGCPWIAMEYLAGDHLGVLSRAARRQNQTLGPTRIARLVREACAGLAYVHQVRDGEGRPMRLVHRDVSPHNVFLCYDGRVKLLDFGIAKAADQETVTRTGVLKGKILYMSPEQVRIKPLDGRSDLFSLGTVMWELLTSKRLFRTDTDYDSMKRICEQDAPDPRTIRSQIPEPLANIVMRCLKRKPNQRYPMAKAMLADLDAFLASRPPDEELLADLAQKLLSKRSQAKLELVSTVKHEGALQVHLFGDLVDSQDETGSDKVALNENPAKQIPQRIRSRSISPRSITPLPDEPVSGASTPDTRPNSPARVLRRRFPLVLAAIILVLAGAGATIVWWFAIGDGAQNDSEQTLGTPTGVMQTSVGLTRGTRRALVSIECDRQAKVFILGRAIGQTPIKNLALKPGSHMARLRNQDSGESKLMRLESVRGKHKLYKVIF